jgi:NDP-sugar pyrophosphorylase family protein
VHAIILAGGRGTRLLPYTEDCPKPLLPLGSYPILEVILRRLRASGFARVTLCIAHLGDMIRSEFGDGQQLGLSIGYRADPDGPLGTAAPLRLLDDWDTPALVMNGDVLATVDLAGLYQRHLASRSRLTVAFRRCRVPTAVGMVEAPGDQIRAIWEKPTLTWNISSGIYVASPSLRQDIPAGRQFDMPDLIEILLRRGEPVHGYRFTGAWHDIGTPAGYARAEAAFLADPQRYLVPEPPAGGDRELGPVPDSGLDPDPDLDMTVLADRPGRPARIETAG